MADRTGLLAVDVGGTKVALLAENTAAESRQAVFRWPDGTFADDLTALAGQVRELVDDGPNSVRVVGVAMPATVDQAGRVLTWPGRPSWTGADLGGALNSLFPGAAVRLADDGDLAALAEADAVGCTDLVYLGVGTGIGGGVVSDGRPVPGPGRGSCELGHVVVDRSGPVCDCGRTGCVQALASGPATLRRAARLRGTQVTFPDLAHAWRDSAGWAVDAVAETCAALATVIVGVAELVCPRIVVVGGGFAAGLPGFVDAVGDHVQSLARPGHGVPPVREAVLGGLSSLRGAVLLAREAAA